MGTAEVVTSAYSLHNYAPWTTDQFPGRPPNPRTAYHHTAPTNGMAGSNALCTDDRRHHGHGHGAVPRTRQCWRWMIAHLASLIHVCAERSDARISSHLRPLARPGSLTSPGPPSNNGRRSKDQPECTQIQPTHMHTRLHMYVGMRPPSRETDQGRARTNDNGQHG